MAKTIPTTNPANLHGPLSRRAAIATGLAAAIAGPLAALPAIAAPSHPDAALFALCARHAELLARKRAVMADCDARLAALGPRPADQAEHAAWWQRVNAIDAEFGAADNVCRSLIDDVVAYPAKTLDGLRAKFKAMADDEYLDDVDTGGPAEALLLTVARDLAGMVG